MGSYNVHQKKSKYKLAEITLPASSSLENPKIPGSQINENQEKENQVAKKCISNDILYFIDVL